MPCPIAVPIKLSPKQRLALQALENNSMNEQSLASRASIILLAAEGKTNLAIGYCQLNPLAE